MIVEAGRRQREREGGGHVGGWCRAALYTGVNSTAFDLTGNRTVKMQTLVEISTKFPLQMKTECE